MQTHNKNTNMEEMKNSNPITYFGVTDFRGAEERFGIKADDRMRHMYVIGKTGMGKSTLLENLAIQDIQNGNGLCFVDPHGTTAEKLLKYVPEHRINDVIYFAPFDTKYPMSLNILEHVEEDKRHLVSSGLMDTFKKVFGEDVFSGRMVYLLNNAVLSLLENEGESLLGINRIFADKDYRKKIISNVKDPAVLSFWNDEFAKYEDKYVKEASAAIQNKIGQFIMTPMIRNIVGQAKSSFDMREVMDTKKILICNFSIGQTGSENVNLIGSLLITKIYLAAMSRANLSYDNLQKAAPFYFYVDEFQNFVNDSFAQILSQARKYNLGLTIAHQYIEQLTDNVKAAVFGNVGTMITFRVGASDAEQLEKEFAPAFTADDIVNLGARQIYLRLSIDGVGSKPFSSRTMPPIPDDDIDYVPGIIASSRAGYAKEKSIVEKEVAAWYEPIIKKNLENISSVKKIVSLEDRFKNKDNQPFGYLKENSTQKQDNILHTKIEPKTTYTLKLKKEIAEEKNKIIHKEEKEELPESIEVKERVENLQKENPKQKSNLALRSALSSALKLKVENDSKLSYGKKEFDKNQSVDRKVLMSLKENVKDNQEEVDTRVKNQTYTRSVKDIKKEDLQKIINGED
jgi:hypothetical protein